MTINNRKILAIIPARGGSKGIVKKNIAELKGQPLITYSILQARSSKYIDSTFVSTDNKEIQLVVKKYNTPIVERPANLATDNSPMKDVVLHVLDYCKEKGEEYDYFVLLQPTSPLRLTEDIDNSIEKLSETDFHSCVSICMFEPHPFLAVHKNGNVMKRFFKESNSILRRQEFPELYRINGAVYVVKITKFLQNSTFVKDNETLYYEMPVERSIDIDSPLDLKIAEQLLK